MAADAQSINTESLFKNTKGKNGIITGACAIRADILDYKSVCYITASGFTGANDLYDLQRKEYKGKHCS